MKKFLIILAILIPIVFIAAFPNDTRTLIEDHLGWFNVRRCGGDYNQDTINSCISTIGIFSRVLYLAKDPLQNVTYWDTNTDIVFPSSIITEIPFGVQLRPALGSSITFGACPKAGGYRIFVADEVTTGTILGLESVCSVVDARWFGVVADGVTDNTLNLKTAIKRSAGSAHLILPPGTIMISGALNPPDNMYVKGQGMGRTTIKSADVSSGYVFFSNDGSGILRNFVIEHLTIDPNAAVNDGLAAFGAIQPGIGIGGRVSYVEILSGFGGHIVLFSGIGEGGDNASHDNLIEKSFIYANDDSVPLFYFKGSYDNRAEEVTIHQAGKGPCCGADDWSTEGPSYATENITFDKIMCKKTSTEAGIAPQGCGTTGGRGIKIINSTFDFRETTNFNGTVITVLEGAPGTNARENIEARNVIVKGNTILLPEEVGNGVQVTGFFNEVVNNTITGGNFGILSTFPNDERYGLIICNNILEDQLTNGLFMNGGDSIIICENEIFGSGDACVRFDADDEDINLVTLRGNKLDGCSQQAVVITETAANVTALRIVENDIGNVQIADAGAGCGIETLVGDLTINVERNLFEFASVPETLVCTGSTQSYVHGNHRNGRGPDVLDLADVATPNITTGEMFLTNGTTAITEFTGCQAGKTFKINADSTRTIDDVGNGKLVIGADFTMNAGDSATFTCYTGGVATLDFFKDNSP
jgi:hypothetical protein